MSGTFEFEVSSDKYRDRAIAIMQLGQQIERQLVSLYEQSITAITSGLQPEEVQHVMTALDNLDPPRKRAAQVVQAAQRFAMFLKWSHLTEEPMTPQGVAISVVGENVVVTVLPPPPPPMPQTAASALLTPQTYSDEQFEQA